MLFQAVRSKSKKWYWNVPGSDSAIVRSTDKDVAFDKNIADSFGVPNKLVENFSLFSKTPLDDATIFKTTKNCFFSEACRHDLISDLHFLFVLLDE